MKVKSLLLGLLMFFTIACNGVVKTENARYDASKWSALMTKNSIGRWDTITGIRKQWTYDIGLLARAVYLSDESAHYDFLKKYVDYFISDDGSIKDYHPDEYNIDRIQAGRNLFILYKRTGDVKYKKAIENLLGQLKTHPRNALGGFWHKKVYPQQMWLDGIYMACPFMAQYAHDFNNPIWYDEAVKQITLIYQYTLDSRTGLLYHAWDASHQEKWCNPENGQSQHFWGRSMGWYCMAIVDVLDYLPENHPKRPELIKILNNVSKALLKVQDTESGLWFQVLDMGEKEGNYLEGSGSAMFAYTFAKGVRKGYLSRDYGVVARKAYHGLIDKLMEKDGLGNANFTHICGSCGLGGTPYRDGSYKYYITEKIVTNDPKGVAPFILASIELAKLK
jgi:unsaturated rhamnogalacturonyl hydrolase